MYPFLLPEIFGYEIPLYEVMILIGIFFMLGYITKRLETKEGLSKKQTNKLLILIIISLFVALFTSWLFDGLFHTIEQGEVTFGPITFLGGLIGGVVTFLILFKFFYNEENKDVRKIMNTVIPGVVLAHAFGRIGCFFAGCCYGIPTDSIFGIDIPHGHAHEVYPGESVFPTQLFESFYLFILFFALNKIELFKNREIEVYLILYGSFRILIEFIRGDVRGAIVPLIQTQYNTYPTPSQFISLILISIGIVLYNKNKNLKSV